MSAPRSQPSGGSGPVQAELDRLERERLGQLASELGTEGLAWLAVAPTWTERIARQTSFPTGSLELSAWLQRAEDAALVEQEPERRADPVLGREFWIAESDRTSVLDFLKSPSVLGDSGLRRVTAEVAKRLQSTGPETDLPVALDRWAALAATAEQPAAAAQRLESEVEQLTRDHRLGEARAAVTAGGALARILGGSHLGNAVDLGNRRLELAYREAADQRHLRRYFKRDDQERAFDALLDTRSPVWALHYMGMGGIGKTMLLRRITSQIARERGLAISRIDFDQQSPDYPVRKPGNLLLALALELRPHVGSEGERLVRQLDDATKELHEQLGAEPPPDDPLWNVKRPEFGRLLNAFADLLRSVPRRVVLLLDTCEELARVPVVNQILPAVEATFEILDRLHDEVPQMRVVLAGRRPLASAGHGWSLRDLDPGAPTDRTHGLRPYLPARPFLALHEILGFTEEEAHRFLTGSWGLQIERQGGLERAVLERSLEAGRAVAFVRTGNEFTGFDALPAGADASSEPLYGPFDLSLYASWLTDDPSLGPEQIAKADGDPYVEIRIVQRIQPIQLRAALPAIVALGRIDEQTLGEALPGGLTPEAIADLYRALADHEWMEQQRDAHTGQLFLEVEPHLLPRLRKYYGHELRAPVADAARRRLVPGLARAVRSSPLGELSVHQIDAALSLLPGPDAAALWTEVLVRVPLEVDWNWLRNVTERLLGGDGALSRQPSLAAGLTVASTSLQLHLSGATRAPSDVQMAAVARWPDEATRSWVTRLHEIWSIDSGLRVARAADLFVELIDRFESVPVASPDAPHLVVRRRSEAEAGALMHAIEDRIERVSLRAPEADVNWTSFADALTAWTDGLAAHEYPVTLVAMAEIIAARVNVAVGRGDEAGRHVERALDCVRGSATVVNPRWLFWREPDSVADRVLLEALVLHRDHLVGPEPEAIPWFGGDDATLPRSMRDWLRTRFGADGPALTATIDGERLVSVLEQWWLDRAVPAPSDLETFEAMELYAVDRQPVAAVHRHTPPLFVTLARKRAAVGDFAGADRRLRDRAREAAATRQDAETVRVATIARLENARASRGVPMDLPMAVRGLDPGLRERSAARPALALRALTGVDVTEGFALNPHEPWIVYADGQRGDEPTMERRRFAHRVGERAGSSVDHALRAMLCAYALGEELEPENSAAVRIIARLLGPTPEPVVLLTVARSLAEYLASEAAQASVTGPVPEAGPGRLLHIVGARRLASIAQDEGELLALWLPEEGARLLDLAARLAAHAGDQVTLLHATVAKALAEARLGGAPKPLDPQAREVWSRATGEPPPVLEHLAQWWSENAMVSPEYERRPSGWQMRYAIAAELGTNPAARAQLSRSKSAWVRAFTEFDRSPELAFVFADPDVEGMAGAAPVPSATTRLPSAAPASARSSVLDQVLAVGAVLLSVALVLYLVGSGALIFPSSSRVGGEPGWGVVLVVMIGMSLAMALLRMWRPSLWETALGATAFLVGFAICYALIGALADWILPEPLGRWLRFGLVSLLLGGLGSVPAAYRGIWSRWRSRVARRSALLMRVEAADAANLRRTDTMARVTMAFTLERVRTAGWRLPVLEPTQFWSTVVDLPTVVRESYERAAAAIDRESLAPLAAIRADLQEPEWTVPILVERADQLPWEGLLSHALTGSHEPIDSVFFYRALPGAGPEWQHGALQRGTVSVLGWSPEAVEIWRRARRNVDTRNGSDSRIIHAVGTPVLGTAGPQFRLAGQHAPSTAEAMLESVVAESPSDAITLIDLPRAVSLLILQQEPAFSSTRFGSDREQAALLRQVAGDLFQRGHAAVLTIPSLPPDLADAVLTAIVGCLSGTPGLLRRVAGFGRSEADDFARLVHAVRAARRAVHTWLMANGSPAIEGFLDDRVEAAWDVCLFTRDPERLDITLATRRTPHHA